MSSRSDRTAARLAIAATFALGAVLTHRADAATTIKVCIDSANPTSATDTRIAREALATQGYAMEPVAFVGHGKEEDDGFPIAKFARLAENECALIMGFPVDVNDPHLPPRVEATPAYAGTGFVMVQRSKAPTKSLAELRQGSEVGIAQLDTWAGMLFSSHPNIVMHVYRDDADMLADVARGKIAAGLTWLSFLQAYENEHHAAGLRSQLLPGAHMQWNLVALYAPASKDIAAVFAKGLDALRGVKLDALVKPYLAATARTPQASIARHTLGLRPPATAQRCGDEKPKAAAKVARSKSAKAKPPALYTEEQAAKGTTAYFQNCSMCHGPLLDGQRGGYPGPALKGKDFADPSYDFHVDEIFRFVAKLMPAQKPGSLTDEQNVDIMAYLLKQNGYPSGSKELSYDEAIKSRVPIRYYGE